VTPPSSSSDGLVVVDKPAGWTSHDVVGRIRRLAGTRKVGHAGTLDPMATGVLVLGVNRATRLLTYLVGVGKVYTGTIRLGVTTVTDDAEGEMVARIDASSVTEQAVREGVRGLIGDLMQVPSSVSAVKIDGKRAYARVRAGEDVELAARSVTVGSTSVRCGGRGRQVPVVDVDVEWTAPRGPTSGHWPETSVARWGSGAT
jgi:tRNA pseudouridine55 synthase